MQIQAAGWLANLYVRLPKLHLVSANLCSNYADPITRDTVGILAVLEQGWYGSCMIHMDPGLVQNVLVSRDDVHLAWPRSLARLRSCQRAGNVLRSSLQTVCIFIMAHCTTAHRHK